MDNNLIILALLALSSNDNKSATDIEALHKIKNYAKDFKVNYNYTRKKIDIFKNILPYLPEDYIETSGRSIITTEKILKVIDVVEFVNIEREIPVEPLELEPAERAYKIVSTLQEQVDNSNIDKLGTALNLVVNKNQYKKMVDVALDFINNKDSLKDPKNLSNLLKPFMNNEHGENNNLGNILEILSMLTSNKEDTEETENIEDDIYREDIEDNEQPNGA